jgi:hypothetical protein
MKAFKDLPNTAVYTCTHVVNEGKSILYVSHDNDDGAWQFMCGVTHHGEESGKIVSLNTILALDNSLLDIADLDYGYIASRASTNSKWIVGRHP